MECQSSYSILFSLVVERRCRITTVWLSGLKLSRIQIEQFSSEFKERSVPSTRCPLSCTNCKLVCLKSVGHIGDHNCRTQHKCTDYRYYCSVKDGGKQNCAKCAGHEGACDCQVISMYVDSLVHFLNRQHALPNAQISCACR